MNNSSAFIHRRRSASSQNLNFSRKDIFLFVVGVLSLIKVRFFGTFALAEILSMSSIFFLPWWRCLYNKQVRILFSMACLWLLSVLVSDLYNDSLFVNSLKGSFNVIFLILDIPFVYWAFYDRPKRILYYWFGVGLGSLIQFYIFSNYESEFEYDVWRVYAYDVLFIALSGILYYRGFKLLSLMAIEGFAIWSLFHFSRNIFLSATISVAMLLFIDRMGKGTPIQLQRIYRQKILLILCSIGLGAVIAFNVYDYTASRGILGENAYNKYHMQKNTAAGIASGRLDFAISLKLISENPFWGYGSYAIDKDGYKERYLESHGYEVSGEDRGESMLPGHSYFLGAWVYSGLLSVPFWLYIIGQICFCLKNGTMLKNFRLMGIVVLLMSSYIWKIFFSPFADRILFVSFVMMLLFLNSASNHSWNPLVNQYRNTRRANLLRFNRRGAIKQHNS